MSSSNKQIENFIKQQCKKSTGAVIGLSGGIDSTLVAYLAVNALGKENVLGICMPYGNQSYDDGKAVAELLGIRHIIINIQHAIAGFAIPNEENPNQTVLGNLKARVRMCYLYMHANEENKLVLGTTNRSEWIIGYFTKHGDGACDIEPIMHLYKREVKELARKLKVPDYLVDRVPSAELWPGQTDEGEFGFTYDDIEEYVTAEYPDVSRDAEKRIKGLIRRNAHKCNLPANLTGNWSIPGGVSVR